MKDQEQVKGSLRMAHALFGLATASLLLASLVLQIESTGAVPGDEFYAAGVLYGMLPGLSIFAQGASLIAAFCLLRTAFTDPETTVLRRSLFALASGILAFAAILLWDGRHPASWCAPLVIVATLLVVIESVGSRASELLRADGPARVRSIALTAAARGPHGLGLLSWWIYLSALGAVGAFLVTFVESYTYTAGFAPKLFPESSLFGYRLRLVEFASVFGLGMGIAWLIPVLVGRFVFRKCEEHQPSARIGVLKLSHLVAGFMTVYILIATIAHVGDEIIETGALPHTLGFLLLVYIFWARCVMAAFEVASLGMPGGPKTTPARVWVTAALAPLFVPMTWLGRELSDRTGHVYGLAWRICSFGALLWLVFLVWTSYPELEDFRSQFIVIGVITAVHMCAMALLGIAFTWRDRSVANSDNPKRMPRYATLALAALLLSASAASLRPLRGEHALILHEYSRFGYVVKKTAVREFFSGWSDLGREPTDQAFSKHGPTERVYPKTVDALYEKKRPPIIFILWDAARHDHMGCYGFERDTTPIADKIAADGVIFESARSMATATSCGVRHIMTGHYSTRYMMAQNHEPFFVHALRKHGYDRILVTAFGSDYNGVSIESFARGGPPPESDGTQFQHLTRHPQGLDRERPDTEKTANTLAAWRKLHKERGTLDGSFTWLHLTGTHFPWWNENAVKDFGQSNPDLYDGEMAKCDALTGQAIQTLHELNAYDDAIIVLLADHGTGLMEHGRWAGFLPYEEQVRIPLIIKMPSIAPHRVTGDVATIDLAPTLVGLFNPGAANTYDGVSLLPLMQGHREKTERRHTVSLCSFEDAYALVEDGRWKLHLHRAEGYGLLYDLHSDPMEQRNLFDEKPELRDRLIDTLGTWLYQGRKDYGNPWHYRQWDGY